VGLIGYQLHRPPGIPPPIFVVIRDRPAIRRGDIGVKCPHCTTSIHESWFVSSVLTVLDEKKADALWRIQFMTCPECTRSILRYGRAEQRQNHVKEPTKWHQLYPSGSSRPPVPATVPPHIAADYNEAATVLESVRRLQAGLQSFLSMRRIDARRKNAKAFRLRHSQSLDKRRQRLSHAMVRSTIQRLGRTTNPLT
jgi:hypothetical protein